MHFSSDISLGSMIALGTIIFALYRFHISNVKRLTILETRVDDMWSQNKSKLDKIDKSTNGDLLEARNRLENANSEISFLRNLILTKSQKVKRDISK